MNCIDKIVAMARCGRDMFYIADALGLNPSSVESHLKRIRAESTPIPKVKVSLPKKIILAQDSRVAEMKAYAAVMPISLSDIKDMYGVSGPTASRLFVKVTGMSVSEYLRKEISKEIDAGRNHVEIRNLFQIGDDSLRTYYSEIGKKPRAKNVDYVLPDKQRLLNRVAQLITVGQIRDPFYVDALGVAAKYTADPHVQYSLNTVTSFVHDYFTKTMTHAQLSQAHNMPVSTVKGLVRKLGLR